MRSKILLGKMFCKKFVSINKICIGFLPYIGGITTIDIIIIKGPQSLHKPLSNTYNLQKCYTWKWYFYTWAGQRVRVDMPFKFFNYMKSNHYTPLSLKLFGKKKRGVGVREFQHLLNRKWFCIMSHLTHLNAIS